MTLVSVVELDVIVKPTALVDAVTRAIPGVPVAF